ncbi:MAG: CHRD domain-containing protein [Actinobacteria bacterium]|nr:CHRD domain-containing protein [Actinomycetota bacterium]
MMKRSMGSACVIAALALSMTACGDEAEEVEESGRQAATTLAERVEDVTRVSVPLSGAAEVPAAGDPDGTGRARLNLDVTKREVCYEVEVQKIDRPVGMHIHEGEGGKSGGIVVPLTTPTASDTTTKGCANVDAALIGRMAANPKNFYLNVHTERYPQGAVRGQLSQ